MLKNLISQPLRPLAVENQISQLSLSIIHTKMKILLSIRQYFLALSIVALLIQCKKADTDTPPPKSSAKVISGFTFSNITPAVAGTINSTSRTISATVANGTDLTKLVPTITISAKATVSPASGVATNFTNPVTYTVTAEDGTSSMYTVTVELGAAPKSNIKEITSFVFNGLNPVVTAKIEPTSRAISATVSNGTDVTKLVPTITLSDKAKISPASGVVQNFTNPVTYTVTAEDNSTQSFTVSVAVMAAGPVSIDKQITGFTFESLDPVVSATINQATAIIEAVVPSFVSITALAPTITLSPNAVVFPASKSFQNFTNPVIYTVTAANGSTQRYEVRVTKKVAVASVLQEAIAGGDRSFFIKSDNSLWVAGYVGASGNENQLYNYRQVPERIMDDIKSVSSGYRHTFFIKTDNSLWAVGDNNKGQLGDGASNLGTIRSTMYKIMNDVKAVSLGWSHSLIIKMDNSLWVTGSNDYGELGDGSTYASRSTPIKIMDDVQAVAAGTNFSLVLKTDNTLWAMGDNRKLQLGSDKLPAKVTKPVQVATNVKAIAAGFSHTLVLKADNTLWAAGDNGSGQLISGIVKDGPFNLFQVMADVKAVTAGYYQAIALKTDNSLWAAGSLGSYVKELNTTVSDYIPVKVTTGVKSISTGSSHTLLIKTDNSVWGIGSDEFGQLGNNHVGGYYQTPERVQLP
ncbi:RCC1 domain-containing protein [Spirosoma endbachense]|uniref:Uncharacterized protein n=1 Tax=Spirosoma endbachense TaxID=2666025 RepID=A0A6P1W1J9_9BACT|nr:DUF5018 domain-containing protein [Spirosoma endbachense]QHV97897.1 hypothetical protein GJR95_24095 [Spirosoma endbachense]